MNVVCGMIFGGMYLLVGGVVVMLLMWDVLVFNDVLTIGFKQLIKVNDVLCMG